MWDTARWLCLRALHGRHEDATWPTCMALSADGKLLASGSTGPFGGSTIKACLGFRRDTLCAWQCFPMASCSPAFDDPSGGMITMMSRLNSLLWLALLQPALVGAGSALHMLVLQSSQMRCSALHGQWGRSTESGADFHNEADEPQSNFA